jgi:hypothetical protein
MVATFDPYTAELDDGSEVLVEKHVGDITPGIPKYPYL